MTSVFWNTGFDIPFDNEGPFIYFQLALSAMIGCTAILLSQRVLRLTRIPFSLLWLLYYVVGVVFHVIAWLSHDAQSYAFLGGTAIHVWVEGLLCIKVLAKNHTMDSWARGWTLYFVVTFVLTMSLWNPLSVFLFGGITVLPIDTLTIPVGLSLMYRATRRWTHNWYFGLIWLSNGVIIGVFFAQLLWGAKTENNYLALSSVVLQIQYLIMGYFVVRLFRKPLPERPPDIDDEDTYLMEEGILPKDITQTGSTGGDWTMIRGLKYTMVGVGFILVVAVVLPLLAGRIDLDMLYTNPCKSFLPGVLDC